MTEAEWQGMRRSLPVPAWLQGRGGRPEGYCHRMMVDAVRYVVDNGVKWANLPKDFPSYRRVHAFARRWQVTGLLPELHDLVRAKEGRDVDPSAAVVDSLGLLPQAGHLRADLLLPGLQQTEHRRHQPPPQTRREQTNAQTLPPPAAVHARPAETQRSHSECGWLLGQPSRSWRRRVL
ncbi:transposase [Streptomyces sp. NPDC059003]|uniref:transposase n=1 Tax=Streptomyces sp. NPDC059003 TaxID=3346691 RepID=UPI0036B52651